MTSGPSNARMLAGGCLCGRLTYRVADRFRYAMFCHCSLCRRATGSAFKALAGIGAEHLTLTAAEGAVHTFGSAAGGADAWHNVGCRHCLSLLYAVVRGGADLHVAMGTLGDTPTIRPSMHVFVGSKAPWYAITDDLPQFEAAPPA